jgi:hypothetical protein
MHACVLAGPVVGDDAIGARNYPLRGKLDQTQLSRLIDCAMLHRRQAQRV